jgi:hypothetical protein
VLKPQEFQARLGAAVGGGGLRGGILPGRSSRGVVPESGLSPWMVKLVGGSPGVRKASVL